jgi:hypothetical protein
MATQNGQEKPGGYPTCLNFDTPRAEYESLPEMKRDKT